MIVFKRRLPVTLSVLKNHLRFVPVQIVTQIVHSRASGVTIADRISMYARALHFDIAHSFWGYRLWLQCITPAGVSQPVKKKHNRKENNGSKDAPNSVRLCAKTKEPFKSRFLHPFRRSFLFPGEIIKRPPYSHHHGGNVLLLQFVKKNFLIRGAEGTEDQVTGDR